MSDFAVRLDGIGKRYRIGVQRERYYTLRDTLTNLMKAPIRRFRRLSGKAGSEKEMFWALKDISLEIKHGDVVGIIGRNGAGKSTLLKILARITEPTEGRGEIHGRVGSLLEVGTGFHPELTGRENIYFNGSVLGMKKSEIDRKFDEIVDFAGIESFLDTPVKRYSSGMYVRLAFAVAAHLEPEILLVDEVLAVGDAQFQKKCLGKMGDVAKEGRTVLFVSHNMAAVQNLCVRVFVLNDGQIAYLGGAEQALSYYANMNCNIQNNRSLAARKDRKGSQWLRFERVRLLNEEGIEVNSAISGKACSIRMDYISVKSVPDASICVAFNVRDHLGSLITTLNSVESGNNTLPVIYEGCFICHWPKLNLRAGTYSCDLFCAVNNEIVDWVQSAFTIHVSDGDFYTSGKLIGTAGHILVDHFWTADSKL